ncbi:hypothetical protein [Pelistega ratti]|uniref:hypothetical protein n=1 Tax=Pelistega ratti TaxID=2652177 RepID=UPI00135C82AF|nr:hypothetical protein [Pelistega ratti]
MSVTLKVLSAKKVIANHNINQGEVLVIDARANSNYQLIDDATGFAPQNIIAKREGKDLKIFLEDGNLNADIVIQGYYGDDQNEEVSNLIVGQHENGNIYAYVPESGEKLDAVSMLADEVAAPQALGGEELSSAFWAFNPWWLLALVPIAGIAIAAGSGGNGGGGKGSPADTTADKPEITANKDGSVTVTPGADNTKVEVSFKNEEGIDKTVIAEKGEDGKWTIPDAGDTGATIDPDTGVITIPENKVKDGGVINAKGTDDKDNTADADEKFAADKIPGDSNGDGKVDGDDDSNHNVTLPNGKEIPRNTDGAPNIVFGEDENSDGYLNAKEITGKDGKDTTPVYITIPENTEVGDTLIVTVNGKEQSIPVTPEMIEKGFTQVDVPVTGDGIIEVTAKVTDTAGQSSNEAKKTVEVDTTVPGDTNEDGTPDNADDSKDTVNVPIIDNDGNESTIKVDKNTDGAPNIIFTENRNGDDFLNKTEIGDDNSTPVQITIPDHTKAGDTLIVTVNGKEQSIPVTDEMVDKGYTTIPVEVIQDGDITVTAKVIDKAGNESATATETVTVDTTLPTAPTVIPSKTDGSVDVTPPTDADVEKVEITYTDEKDQPQTITVTKGDDGQWKAEGDVPNGTVVDPATGKVTIPQDNVKDGSEVTAKATDTTGNTGDEGKGTVGTDSKNAKPIAEDKDNDGNPDGVVSTPAVIDETGDNNKVTTTITLDNNNGADNLPIQVVGSGTAPVSGDDFDTPVVTYTDPADGSAKTLAPNPDGTYNVPAGVTELKVEHTAKPDNTTEGAETGKVKAGEVVGNEVTVNDTSTSPLPEEANAPTLAKDPAHQGGAVVTPGADNTAMVVTFPDEKDQPQTVTVKKGDDGQWQPEGNLPTGVTVDPATGKVTIAPDAVKDGAQVNATGKETGKTDKDGQPVTTDTDAKNAKPIAEDKDNDGNPDGVVSTPAVIDETGDNNKVTTTITLDNNNGADNLPIQVVGSGTAPVSGDDFDTPVVTYTDPVDGSAKTLAPNPDGTYNVPAGVTELKVEHTAKPDNTTEGAETGKVKAGEVVGNEVTVNDTSTSPLPEEANAPTLAKDPDHQGGAVVTPGADNTAMVVTFTDEKDQPQTVTVKKGDDGKWKPEGTVPEGVTIDPTTGKVTIAPDAVKDGAQVNATGKETGKTDKDGQPVTTDTDAKNAKPIAEDKDNDGNPDGVVSTPAVIDETGDNNKVTTTITLDNNNGADNLPIQVVGSGTAPVSGDDFDTPVVTYTDPVDGSAKTLAPNSDGTYNVPAGVTELKVEHTAKPDNTTEGAETGKVKAGDVVGNEVTVNDTSLAPQNAKIDITQIAGDSQAADATDDGTSAGDVYAQISPAEAAAGFLISGTSKDIAGDITVTIAEKDGSAIVTKTVTPKEDGTWSVNIEANALTGYEITKEYEVKATGSSADGTAVEDIDLTASTPQVTAIKLKDNLTDEPLVDGTYEYTNYYADGDAKYVGDVTHADNLSAANSLATGLTNDKDAVLEFTLDKAPTAGQEVKVYRYTLSESADKNNPYTTHGKTEVTGDMVSADGLTYTVTPKGDNVLGDTYTQNYRYEVVVSDKNSDNLSTGSKGTFDFRLDTLVEQMSVEKFDIDTGRVVFVPTGLSEVGATIEYRYATGSMGKSSWSKAIAGADGRYNLQLNNFNRKVSGAIELRITDAAGNVSETKVSLLRNLTSVINTQEGPDPSRVGDKLGAPLTFGNFGFDDPSIVAPKQPTTNASKGGFVSTSGNDTFIVGLEHKKFGKFGEFNGTFGGTAGSSDFRGAIFGAGDDSIQFRGEAQSMTGQAFKMGAGNDRISVAGDIVIGDYTFDLGKAEDISGNTNILYIGGNVANGILTHNIYGGAGNDSVRIDGTFNGLKNIDLGGGNNELRVGYGAAGGSDLLYGTNFVSGQGNDIISVKGDIRKEGAYPQTFNLGNGDNFIEVGGNIDTDGSFTFGSGVDTVNIKGTLKGGKFTFGAGDDSLTVGTINTSGIDNIKLNMGEGVDTITITGTQIDTSKGAINGGNGNDTIFLQGKDLKLEMSKVLNVETIDMRAVTGGTGNQKVALTLEDLQQGGDTITELYIKGDVGDTVDFGNNGGDGNNNGARDGVNGKEYRDNRGTNLTEKGNWNVWQKVDSDIVKDGVVYDKYTYNGSAHGEEVYIQQGIQII